MCVNLCSTQKQYKCAWVLRVGESFGIVAWLNLQGSVNILHSNMAIHPHTAELPWTVHRFFMNSLYEIDDYVPY